MIKDQRLRLFFIPLLGILIPFVSGIIHYDYYNSVQLISANLYFIFVSFSIWVGCNRIHVKIRPQFKVNSNVFIKVASISLLSSLYAACTGGMLTMIWFRISKEVFTWQKVFEFIAFTSMAVILFTLVYEILFLTKERQIDTKVVDELDRERMQAEMSLLKNEMDPHFIFNSLTTLNHLILNNPSQAHLYNNKLAQVYKYFLINKNKEMISLHDELEFIESYFFLLQLRHENKLEMEAKLNGISQGKIMILPCALQVLFENAIKHNEFSNANPLKITIAMNGQYIKVSNNTKPKPYLNNSTNLGLKNLSSRYKLVCNKDIVIEKTDNLFTVKLPLIGNF